MSSRTLTAIASLLCLLGVMVACQDPDQDAECEPFAPYRGHAGTTVTITSTIRDVEADRLARAWESFEHCTGIDLDYEGSAELEATLEARLRAGTGPDIAALPQPGLLARLARAGLVQPASPRVQGNAAQWYSPDWLSYGTVAGTLYAVPMDAHVKSFVWYSPKLFRERGYTVPETWAELRRLSEEIASDGITPWCAGIESGAATGWPVTDWLEDVLLRAEGTAYYDRWVAHDVPVDDRPAVDALDQVGEILKDPRLVNGGYGGVESIATVAFQDGGLPILEGTCAMHRQGSFYATWWPSRATIGEDADLYAFYLPPIDPAHGRPVLAAATFTAAFTDRPEVEAVTAYLSTPEFANSRARTGDAASANRGLDPASLPSPVSRLAAQTLHDPDAQVRFDGSDLMPASVGSEKLWAEMTAWIRGKDSATALRETESSWPP